MKQGMKQGMKKGIMEWVDILVVNKADGANITQAETAANVYQQSLHWFPQHPYAWTPRAVCASSINPDGILEVIQTIEKFFNHMHENARLTQRRQEQVLTHFKQLLQHEWMQMFWNTPTLGYGLFNYGTSVNRYTFNTTTGIITNQSSTTTAYSYYATGPGGTWHGGVGNAAGSYDGTTFFFLGATTSASTDGIVWVQVLN